MDTPPKLFDRALLLQRRKRAQRMAGEDFLLNRVAEDLTERLQAVKRRFPLTLDLATPGGHVAQALKASGQTDRVIVSGQLAERDDVFGRACASEEALPFADASFDLVVSALALHWTNDLPGALVQLRRALKPDGLLLAVLLGGETLTELRQCLAEAESEIEGGLSPRVSPFVEVRTMGSLLQRAGFTLPVTDIDRLTVRYAKLSGLFLDLRRMGATNALNERSRRPLKRATLARTAELYAKKFSDPDGKLRATFDLLWISGWAPSDSQPRPLRPGSAMTRLADALGTKEQSAGEKSGPGKP